MSCPPKVFVSKFLLILDQHFGVFVSNLLFRKIGQILCFGYNTHGQCGLGHNDEKIGDVAGEMGDSMEATNLGSDFYPVQLGGGGYTGCAISSNHEVKWYVVCVDRIFLSLILSLHL